MDKATIDMAHLEQADTIDTVEKPLSKAYTPDPSRDSHHKSKEERRLVLKADLVILPLAALTYFVAYLDRNSIGNARLMGLQKDLHMTANQYYNCLMMFCKYPAVSPASIPP